MKWGSVRLIIGIGVLLVSYQNCGGPVQFQEVVEQASLSVEPELPPPVPLTCEFDGKVLNEEDPRCANHFLSAARYALDSLKPGDTDLHIKQERRWQLNEVNRVLNSSK